jgi:hypothetical protein
MKSPINTRFGLLASFLTIGAAQASVITIAGTEYIRPYAVTSTSTLNGLPHWNPNSHHFLIDGSGINTTTGKGDGRASSQWLSESTISPTIVFDLGSPFDLRGTHVWNMWLDPAIYSENQGDYAWAYGVNGLTLSTSVDGTSFSTGTHFNFTAATLGADDVGQDYLFVANGVRYVKFVIDANPNNNFTWVGNRNEQYFTGLQEVVFMAAPMAVPEPGSLLVLGSLVGGGILLRTRRRSI